MNHINRTLDSEGDCGVYFFKTWTGYSHPVTPMEPCTYEQAIRQTSYYRAWLCASGGKNRFLMLEGMLQSAKPYAGQLPAGIPGDVEFLRVVRHGDAVEAAAPLELADTFDEREYVRLERLGDGGLSPSLVNVRLKLRYRYHYGANGALKKADITNIDGETTTLDF